MANKKKKISLFGDDEEGGPSNANWEINKGYATKYDNWRRLEEMQKIKDRFGDVADEDSSSSESEPEWTDEHEEAFLKTLGALKSGDRTAFENGKSFFKKVDESELNAAPKKKEPKKKSDKMTIKDYERKLVLEKGGQIDESDEEEEQRATGKKGYYEEQEELRKSLAAAINNKDDEEDDILVERKKTKEEQDNEDEDFYKWMKSEEGKADKVKSKELRHLKKFWKDDDNLDESEKFLRDYLLNKDYEPGKEEENPTYEEIVALEEDEKEIDRNKKYEHKYNFRFEDPDQEFIKQYPRTVAESMRSENSNRKEKRNERDDRKKQEKEEKKKELQELKKMKRSEIEQKLLKLQKAAGCDIPLTIDELNADFDPKEFDKKMQTIFNDEYYGIEENIQEDDDEKPVFSDMEDSDYEDYDDLDVEELKKNPVVEKEDDMEDEEDDDEEEEEKKSEPKKKRTSMKNGKFDMVTAAQNAMKQEKNEGRKKKKENPLKAALSRKKPLFNPKEKTFEEYFNEYYALDYEDIIGDQVTRFHYRETEPNDFGLTTDEILEADERQLNAWASLKKVTAYRNSQEENFDRKAYQRKAQDVQKKKKILSIDFGGKKSLKRKAEDEEMQKVQDEMETEVVQNGEPKKKKKRGKKKTKKVEDVNGAMEVQESEEKEEVVEETPEEVEVEKPVVETKAPEKKRRRKQNNKQMVNKNTVLTDKFGKGMTDSRVKAYGLNPSRLKKGLVYGSGK